MQMKSSRELVAIAVLVLICIQSSLALSYQRCRRVNKSRKMVGLAAVESDGVVPDVIDKVPSEVIEVCYPSEVTVQLGNKLTPTQVKDFPQISYKADPNKLYTIMMVDPDAPSRQDPKWGQFLHMLIGNVPGVDLSKGDTFAEYIGAGAPKGTGYHRYIFLLYEQTEKLVFDLKVSNKSREGRRNFTAKEFAKTHNLGEPIAINFFQAQFDDYVPILHAQLASG